MLPNPQDAYNHLVAEVDQRAFFQTLANLGTVPRTEKEAADLYRLGATLAAAEEEKMQKAAAAGGGLSADVAAIENHLARLGYGQGNQQKEAAAAEDASIRQYAAGLAQDANTYNAVLALKVAEAGMFAAQAGAR